MWFLGVFLMHVPHCHYGPLLGGDRDGAEGVDGCRCRARLSLLRLLSGACETLPTKWPRQHQHGSGCKERAIHVWRSAPSSRHIHLLLACVWTQSPRTVLLQWFQCLLTAEWTDEEYLHMILILMYCVDVKRSIEKHLSMKKYVQEHCKYPHFVWTT